MSESMKTFVSTLKADIAAAGRKSEIYTESLDLLRLPTVQRYRESSQEYLGARYDGVPIDIIIAQTIEAVRSYARDSEAGAKDETASVSASVDRALSLFRGATRKDLRVVLRLDPDLPPVAAGESSLLRILTNLFQNSVQAMRGIGELEVVARREDGFAVVEVLDTGPGVPEAVRDRLFTPMASTIDIDQGLGLGLSICSRIVDGLGGTISHGTREGRTMFTVRLPVAER